jgi:subtilase family serine protease
MGPARYQEVGTMRAMKLTVATATLGLAVAGVGTTAAAPLGAAVSIAPQIAMSRLISTSGPPTTAQCEAQFQVACYSPNQIEQAYDLGPLYAKGYNGAGKTIVIVDSFGSTTVRRDLDVFDKAFGLPAPPSFKIIQPAGAVPHPNSGWAGETDLDVEYSHAIAPGANILLVETPTSENEGTTGFPQIVDAENYVVNHHLGDVISQSFGATEATFPSKQSLLNLRSAYVNAANHNVTVLTASGDSGAADVGFFGINFKLHPVTSWPDSDPLITGVGGTQLHLNAAGKHTAPDNVWNDTYNVPTQEFIFGDAGPNPLAGGGGTSIFFSRPSYQNGVASVVGTQRGVPDISMSGACNGGAIMYQSFKGGGPPGFYVVCGTSESSPLFSGIVAIADQYAGHDLGLLNPALYAMSAAGAPGIVDIVNGNNTVTFTQNGTVHTIQGFDAVSGYDLASGVGTVDAAKFVPELAAAS